MTIAVIRLLDIAAHLIPDFETILLEKLAYNRCRDLRAPGPEGRMTPYRRSVRRSS